MHALPTPASLRPDPLPLPPSPRLLVICTRRLGDVLLATPLLRTLRHAWPSAELDVLVNPGSEVVLAGNPDINSVRAIPPGAALAFWGGLWRRYDLAVGTLVSDRAHFTGFIAGRRRVGLVPPAGAAGARWKRVLNHRWAVAQHFRSHAVINYLRLADALGIERSYEVVPPRPVAAGAIAGPSAPYAVLHAAAMYPYKDWPLSSWEQLGLALWRRGLRLVLTGGPAATERAAVAALGSRLAAAGADVTDAAGRLSFAELTPLIEGARLFVGPDTSVTHLAAATGVPTLALYGPSNTVTWGPWPRGFAADVASPWLMQSPLQHQGNVRLLQGLAPCVPCHREGCERRPQSRAACLDELPVSRVLAAADQALSG